MSPRFPAHGNHRFRWSGEVLCIEIFGVLNLEEVEVFFASLRQVVTERGLTRWGRIVDLRHWEGITPDAKVAYAAISDWYPTVGAVAHVQIYPSSFVQAMADAINRSVARVGPVRQCASVEEGLEWLETFGLKTGNAMAKDATQQSTQ